VASSWDDLLGLDLGWELTAGSNPFSKLTDYDIRKKSRRVCYRCGWACKMDLPENQNSNSYDLVSKTNLEVLTKNEIKKPYKIIKKENDKFEISELKQSNEIQLVSLDLNF
jgi:hypothetical protein